MTSLFAGNCNGTLGETSFDMSFDLEDVPFTVIWGRSGSGKTTLLRYLAGLTSLQGDLKFRGQKWQCSETFFPTHKRSIGFVFQDNGLLSHLNVAGNFAYALKRSRKRQMSVDDVYDSFGVRELMNKKVEQLSGGEKQRVSLARTILSEPDVILMDEPLSSLDVATRRELVFHLRNLRKWNIPVIFVTHAVEEMVALADRALILESGRVLYNDELDKTLRFLSIEQGRGFEPVSVLKAQTKLFDDEYGLQEVDANGQSLFLISDTPYPVSCELNICIKGQDVTLYRSKPKELSALNQMTGTIDSIHTHGSYQALVEVDTACGLIRTLITRKSFEQLGLTPGDSVFLTIKALRHNL